MWPSLPPHKTTWPLRRYVEQQDSHSAGTTIREALLFSARLRLEESIGMPQVHQIVDDTLEMVDLRALKDGIVGEPGALPLRPLGSLLLGCACWASLDGPCC